MADSDALRAYVRKTLPEFDDSDRVFMARELQRIQESIKQLNSVVTLVSGRVDPSTGTAVAWTPVLSFGASSTGITYAAQTGRAYKVGPLVAVSLLITLARNGESNYRGISTQ